MFISPALLTGLLLGGGLLLLLSAPLVRAHRFSAAVTGMAIILGGMFLNGILLEMPILSDAMLAVFLALLVAAPILERGRFIGLTFGAIVGGTAILYIDDLLLVPALPTITPLAAMMVAMVAALILGMAGGITLPLHPKRYRANGTTVWHGAPQAWMFAGWAALMSGMALLAFLMDPTALSKTQFAGAVVAGFVALIGAESAEGENVLQKTGEGLAAGLLITLLAPVTPMAGAALGLVAGFFVIRSEAMSLALRMDDPHHFLGALLFPAMAALLIPGIHDSALLASALQWLGAAIAVGFSLSLILWPLTMLFVGVSLPPRQLREKRA